MPIDYHIDFVEGIFEVSASGRLTGRELIDGLERIFADESWRPDMPQLWDGSQISALDVDFSEFLEMRSMMPKSLYPDRMKWEWTALVITSRLVYTFIRMVQAMFSQQNARIFTDRKSALSWLYLAPSERFSPLVDDERSEISEPRHIDPHDDGPLP